MPFGYYPISASVPFSPPRLLLRHLQLTSHGPSGSCLGIFHDPYFSSWVLGEFGNGIKTGTGLLSFSSSASCGWSPICSFWNIFLSFEGKGFGTIGPSLFFSFYPPLFSSPMCCQIPQGKFEASFFSHFCAASFSLALSRSMQSGIPPA